MRALRANLDLFLFVLGLVLLVAGCIGWAIGNSMLENVPWITSTVIGIVVSTGWMVESIREGRFGVDIIAVLALVGALLVGEPFAGAMITVMLVTGRVLEARAQQRARRDLSLLVQRAPRTARRVDDSAVDRTSGPAGDGTRGTVTVVEVPVEDIRRGDHVLVGSGEVVPVDGRLRDAAVLDESSLTGESLPVDRVAGDTVRSGAINAGPAFGLTATSEAASSTYAQIPRLVEQAQASSAPFVRAADRIAVIFVPFTLLLAGGAWLVSGDATLAVAGAGGGHAVPVAAGSADRDHVRVVQGGPQRCGGQGRRGVGTTGGRPGTAPRQDRDGHPRRTCRRRHRHRGNELSPRTNCRAGRPGSTRCPRTYSPAPS